MSSAQHATKRRNRNVNAELRILSSRSNSKRNSSSGRSLNPVVKNPSITYSRSGSFDTPCLEPQSFGTEVTFDDDASVTSVESAGSAGSFDSVRVFSNRPQQTSGDADGGRFGPLFHHTLLTKDRSSFGRTARVRFDVPAIGTSGSTPHSNDGKLGNKSKGKKGNGLMSKLMRRKKSGKLDDVPATNEADLLRPTSTDSTEIASIIKDSTKFSKSSKANRFANVEEALATGKAPKKTGPQHVNASPLSPSLKSKAGVYTSLGDALASDGKFEEAMRSYMKAVDVLKGKVSDHHPALTGVLEKLRETNHIHTSAENAENILRMGQEQENLGRYGRACKSYTVSYRIQRDALGKNHPSLAKPLNLLSSLLAKRGQYLSAMRFIGMALEVQRRDQGGSPEAKAVTIRNMGSIHEEMGDHDKALELYHESLKLHKDGRGIGSYSGSSGSTARGRSSVKLADLLIELCPISESVEVFLESSVAEYQVDLKHRGADQEDVDADVELAITLNSIGRIFARHYKRHTVAMQAYVSSLAWMKAALGPNHPNVAALLGNLGNLCKDIGDYDRAFQIYQEVLRIEQVTFGRQHPEVAVTMHNIGTIEYARRNYDKALGSFQTAMKIQKQVFGIDSALVSVASNSIGEVCEQMGDTGQALLAYKVAMEIDAITFGKDHPEIGRMMQKIAMVHYRHTGKYAEAEELCIRALRIYRFKALAVSHPLMQEVHRNLADIRAAKASSSSSSSSSKWMGR